MQKIMVIKSLNGMIAGKIAMIKPEVDAEENEDIKVLRYAIEAVKAYRGDESTIAGKWQTEYLEHLKHSTSKIQGNTETATLLEADISKDLEIAKLQGMLQAYREVYDIKPLDQQKDL